MAKTTQRLLSPRVRTILKRSWAGVRTTLVPTAAEQFAWQLAERIHRTEPDVATEISHTTDIGRKDAGENAPPYVPVERERPPSLFEPAPGAVNPVLTAADVSDFGDAHCVADPFLFVTERGNWHLFFEIYNHRRNPTAVIGHAESDDGYDWHYDRVVLATDEHLSYPCVFRWNGEHYMVPDRWEMTGDPTGVTLYRAKRFPYDWTAVAELVQPVSLSDFVPFRWEDRWWALLGNGRDLHAYYSDELEAPNWTPHSENPLVVDRPRAGRPAGRPLVFEDRILAFYQDSVSRYGHKTRAFEITSLTPTTFSDTERSDSPVLEGTGGFGWNSGAMHHVDPWYDGSGWHCAVDGNIGLGYRPFEHHWAIGIYRM